MGFFCNFRRVLAESNFSLLLLKLLSILKSALSCASQDCLHCLRATQCSKLTGLTGLPACSVMSDSFLLQGIFPTQPTPSASGEGKGISFRLLPGADVSHQCLDIQPLLFRVFSSPSTAHSPQCACPLLTEPMFWYMCTCVCVCVCMCVCAHIWFGGQMHV